MKKSKIGPKTSIAPLILVQPLALPQFMPKHPTTNSNKQNGSSNENTNENTNENANENTNSYESSNSTVLTCPTFPPFSSPSFTTPNCLLNGDKRSDWEENSKSSESLIKMTPPSSASSPSRNRTPELSLSSILSSADFFPRAPKISSNSYKRKNGLNFDEEDLRNFSSSSDTHRRKVRIASMDSFTPSSFFPRMPKMFDKEAPYLPQSLQTIPMDQKSNQWLPVYIVPTNSLENRFIRVPPHFVLARGQPFHRNMSCVGLGVPPSLYCGQSIADGSNTRGNESSFLESNLLSANLCNSGGKGNFIIFIILMLFSIIVSYGSSK